jgi:leucyl aminopeptidase
MRRFESLAATSLSEGYPLIAAVGGAAAKDRAPRLIEAEWGNPNHPRIAIVGKGVCFDTGGLDIKGGAGMRLMKKDMGGAAHALALAWLIAVSRVPVRLHLLIPAVENAISGGALRPGDIVRSRKGLQRRDRQYRRRGAARPCRCSRPRRGGRSRADPRLRNSHRCGPSGARSRPAGAVRQRRRARRRYRRRIRDVDDPVWRMPLWDAYDEMLKSDVADLANAAGSPMAGAVVAAMFMKRFVPDATPWAHLDTFAWRESAKPGRPKGGEAMA